MYIAKVEDTPIKLYISDHEYDKLHLYQKGLYEKYEGKLLKEFLGKTENKKLK